MESSVKGSTAGNDDAFEQAKRHSLKIVTVVIVTLIRIVVLRIQKRIPNRRIKRRREQRNRLKLWFTNTHKRWNA